MSQTPGVSGKSIPDAVPVPVHGNQSIKRGPLGNILRTVGISRENFDRLL